MRRTGVAVVTTLAVALSVTACAGSTPEEDGRLASGTADSFTVAVRKGDNDVVQSVVDRWNSQHPETTATVEWLDGNADQQRQQLSLELDAGSDDFDVIGLDVTWTGEFAKNGWIENLEPLHSAAEKATFPGPLTSGVYEGDLYTVPLLVGVGLLYYRTDLIDRPAASWQELSAQGRAAAAGSDVDAFVGQGASYEGMVVNYLEYLWSAGGDLFNDDYSRATLTDGDAALKALRFMQESYEDSFYAPGFTTMTEAEAQPAFEDGGSALMRHWIAPYIPMSTSTDSAISGNFSIAPLPTFGGEESVAALGGLNLAVNEYSTDKAAASAFVEWSTTSPDAQQVLVDAGIAPAAKSAYSDANLKGNEFMKALATILPSARARPVLPQWGEISTVMSREIFAAYTGQKSPGAALEAIQETLENAVAENGA